MAGLGHRGGALARGVEDTLLAGAKAAAQDVDVRERGHDRPAAGSVEAFVARHALDLPQFVAHALVAQGLERIQGFEILGGGDAVE